LEIYATHAGDEVSPAGACLRGFGSTPEWGYARVYVLAPLADGAAHSGKASQQFNVVEQGIAETRGSLAVVFGNVADDFSEIG